MYGSKLRIGIMVPCVNTVMGMEFAKMAPQGVATFEARMLMRGQTKVEQLLYMQNSLADTVESLMDVADVMAYGCTSGSFIKGRAFDEMLVAKIREQAQRPAVSAAGSILAALDARKAKRIVLATPYIEEVNARQKAFFESAGVEVAAMRGLNISARGKSGTLEPAAAYELVKAVYKPDLAADAVVISCTNFRTAEILQTLEDELSLPVISSNQAVLWAALRAGGVDESVSGYGSLLA